MDRNIRPTRAGLSGLIILLLGFFAADGLAGTNQWTSMGPEGGYVNLVTWHPTRSEIAFAVTDRVYRTTDSGAHWVAVSEPIVGGMNFGFHPANADRILLAGMPLLYSADGGLTFAPVASNQRIDSLAVSADGGTVFGTADSKVYRSGDFGQTWTEIAMPIATTGEYARQILISPDDQNTLYINYTNGNLFNSTNGGLNWTQITSLPGYVNFLAINPRNGQQMLAAEGPSATLWRSTNGGATWTAVLVGSYYTWIAFDPLVANRVVANQYLGLEYSTDGGALWFEGARRTAVEKKSGALSSVTSGKLIAGTSAGVEVSTDGGLTLQARNTGLFSSDLRAIGASRTSPYRIYASFFGGPEGLHVRQGAGWQATGTAALVSALQDRISIEALAVDPQNSSIVYVSGWSGVAKTADGGVTWSRVLQGNSYFTGLAVDRINPQIVYAASNAQGILRSQDGGSSWAPRNSGLPLTGGNPVMRQVYVDPLNPQRLYAIDGNVLGLYRSQDAGLNWSLVQGGLPQDPHIQVLAVDPLDSNRVYAGTAQGIYGSTDAGVTWTRMTLPVNSTLVTFIEADPVVPGVLVVGVSGGVSRVIRSVDYGATWESLLWDPGLNNYNVPWFGTLDPAQPGNVIVGSSRLGTKEFQISPDLSLAMSGVATRLPLDSTPTLRITVQNKPTSLFAATDVTLSFTLPAALVPGAISTSRGSCTSTGQSFTCRLGSMKVTDAAQIDLPLTVITGTGTISAAVVERELDLAPADNVASAALSVQPFADLRATLSQPATANHGGPVTLDAQVTNLGPNPALNARAVFTLPAGLTAVSGGVCTANGATVTCQLGTLSVNASALVQLAPISSTVGQHAVSVSTDSSSFDPDGTNNSASTTVTVRPVADVAVVLTGPTSLPVGQVGTGSAAITNAGPDPVNVAVVSLSGSNLNLGSATAAGGTCSITSSTANCSLGSLAVGESRLLDVTFAPIALGAVQISASTNTEAQDPVSGNNAASRSVVATASADIGVTLTSAPSTINRQSSTVISARVSNAGPTAAGAARLVISLPPGLAAASAAASLGACTTASGTVDCAFGSLNAGDVATVDVSATGAAAGAATINGTVSTTAFDATSANNVATSAVTVRGLTDLSISMSSLPASLQTGQTASATITVTNNGPDDATITVANLAPVNFDVQSAVPAAGTCSISASSTNCSLGALASGASRTIAVTVSTRATGTASLTASTSFEGGERLISDNTATGSISVSAPPSGGGGGATGGSGSGGGGALSTWGVLALLAWVLQRGCAACAGAGHRHLAELTQDA